MGEEGRGVNILSFSTSQSFQTLFLKPAKGDHQQFIPHLESRQWRHKWNPLHFDTGYHMQTLGPMTPVKISQLSTRWCVYIIHLTWPSQEGCEPHLDLLCCGILSWAEHSSHSIVHYHTVYNTELWPGSIAYRWHVGSSNDISFDSTLVWSQTSVQKPWAEWSHRCKWPLCKEAANWFEKKCPPCPKLDERYNCSCKNREIRHLCSITMKGVESNGTSELNVLASNISGTSFQWGLQV